MFVCTSVFLAHRQFLFLGFDEKLKETRDANGVGGVYVVKFSQGKFENLLLQVRPFSCL